MLGEGGGCWGAERGMLGRRDRGTDTLSRRAENRSQGWGNMRHRTGQSRGMGKLVGDMRPRTPQGTA